MQPGTETLCVSVGEIISMQGIAAAYDESPMLHQKRAAPFRVFALFSSINIRGFEPERVPALRKQFGEFPENEVDLQQDFCYCKSIYIMF